jgi:methylated-DNA-protein-cysteine methyltransferase related protein
MAEKDFFEKVYEIVALIPSGKVTTYGDIARVTGMRCSARMVGWALNSIDGDNYSPMGKNLPAHRVVNRNGELTGKIHFATPYFMREMLESEGVEFIDEHVNIEKHLWLPLSD